MGNGGHVTAAYKKEYNLDSDDKERLFTIFYNNLKTYQYKKHIDLGVFKDVTILNIPVQTHILGLKRVILPKESNPFKKLFDNLSVDYSLQNNLELYHFKSISRAIEILATQRIKLYNLKSQSQKDYSELKEFFHRYVDSTNNHPINDNMDSSFIFCFTNDIKNKKAWQYHAENETGVAFKFQLHLTKENTLGIEKKIRGVYYDKGYDFDVFNNIFHQAFDDLKIRLDFLNKDFSWFGSFYKKGVYKWEQETRLFLNIQKDVKINAIENFALGNRLKKYSFIEAPLKNNIFELNISQIILGINTSEIDKSIIESMAKKLNIEVIQHSK